MAQFISLDETKFTSSKLLKFSLQISFSNKVFFTVWSNPIRWFHFMLIGKQNLCSCFIWFPPPDWPVHRQLYLKPSFYFILFISKVVFGRTCSNKRATSPNSQSKCLDQRPKYAPILRPKVAGWLLDYMDNNILPSLFFSSFICFLKRQSTGRDSLQSKNCFFKLKTKLITLHSNPINLGAIITVWSTGFLPF